MTGRSQTLSQSRSNTSDIQQPFTSKPAQKHPRNARKIYEPDFIYNWFPVTRTRKTKSIDSGVDCNNKLTDIKKEKHKRQASTTDTKNIQKILKTASTENIADENCLKKATEILTQLSLSKFRYKSMLDEQKLYDAASGLLALTHQTGKSGVTLGSIHSDIHYIPMTVKIEGGKRSISIKVSLHFLTIGA